MLVQCPGCHTTYRVAEDAVATPKPTFRCSRCKNVFVLGAKPAASPRERADAARSEANESEELSFSFPASTAGGEKEDRSEENISELSAPAAPNGPAAHNEESLQGERSEQEWSLFHEGGAGEDFGSQEERVLPEFDRPDDSPFVFAREREALGGQTTQGAAASNRRLSATPFLLVCIAVVVLAA